MKLNKMGKVTVFGLSLIIAMALALGVKHNIHKKQIAELETSIEVVKDKVDDFKHKKQNMESTIDMLVEQNQKFAKENERLRKQVRLLKKKVKDFETNYFKVEATAYDANCDAVTIDGVHYGACSGITAIGHDVRSTIKYKGKRIIAVDPDVIPLYSLVEVTVGSEKFQAYAVDTGGAIDGSRIDILVNNKSEAFKFGRKEAVVRVIKWG